MSEPGCGPAGKDTGSHPHSQLEGHTDLGKGTGFGTGDLSLSPNFAINLVWQIISPGLILSLFIFC